MIVLGLVVKRSVHFLSTAALLLALVGATPAQAAEPWWNLSSGSIPGVLQSGQAKDEVQEITVSATGGEFLLIEVANGAPNFAKHTFLPYNVTATEMQEHLENEVYPYRRLAVTEPESGSKRFVVTFPGQAVEPMFALSFLLSGGEEKATVTELAKGMSDGQIMVSAENVGDANLSGASQPFTITDKLPAGLTAEAIQGEVATTGGLNTLQSMECSFKSLTCASSDTVQPYEAGQLLISVSVNAGAKSGEANEIVTSGGNAPSAKISRPITLGNGPTPFGVEDYEMTPEEEGGGIDTQSGSHPFQLTTNLFYNRRNLEHVAALGKDLKFNLPPGLIGNPSPFPQCTVAKFVTVNQASPENCADNTVVGVANVDVNDPYVLGGETNRFNFAVPLFNLTPATGEPARFGFKFQGTPVYLDTSVRTGGDYGVVVTVKNITEAVDFKDSRVTFWGVPGDRRHDNYRGWSCLQPTGGGVPCKPMEARRPPPLLELPTSCSGPLRTSVESDSWEHEGSFQVFAPKVTLSALDGCNDLPFTPSMTVTPDGHAGSTPTGLTVGIHVPQEVSLDAEGLGEADVKNTKVTLPAGVALNPAGADGLLACSEEQVALQTRAVPTCPEAAKVGSVEIKSPLLPNPLVGAAYLATQNANPFGSLVALYIVAQDPVSGTLIKVAGEVKPDPVTGQLVSTFNNTPQLPFEELKLHFFGGSRAPLNTPVYCGSYTTTSSIEPWSGNPPAEPSSDIQILEGPNGTPCASPLPFSPSLTAGTTSIQAGGFSPFTMTMSRGDGQQNLQSVQLHMPSGLLGTLSTVKLCDEAHANAGTCGPENLIGETIVSVGLGGTPYSVRGGKVYITGPYHGAPFGLSIVNPAKAGPFDLGQVIVRAKVEVDPITSVLTITTDSSGPYAIPQIIDGIPLQIKHINVTINRPNFTFNPTNCTPTAITGNLTSSQGLVGALSVPFQVTNCAVLAFKPKLTAKTSGKTSRANGASLSVRLTYPAGPYDANIARVKVDLPKQLPSRLTTLQKACPAATFEANPANCPAASIIGHATATTPVLPVPLTGPAYFVSHGGEAFPSLIIVLQGYGVTVHLVGTTFISKAGITSSTFKTIPDVPVGTFELTLPNGPGSALAANGNLCSVTRTVLVKRRIKVRSKGHSRTVTRKVRKTVSAGLFMPTAFNAQNGAVIHENTPIEVTGCSKTKKAKPNHKNNKKKGKKKK